MTSQDAFRAALLSPGLPPPSGLGDGRGGPVGRRFDVYRNNVASSLIDALEVGFPAVQKLIGSRNFRAVMGAFLRSHPPDAPMIAIYGAALPSFLTKFAPLRHLPYLADVARLEQALRESYHAADAAPLDPAFLQGSAPDDLPAARLDLAPPLRIIRSRWPVHAIWAYNMEDGAPQPPATPQDVIITRPGFDPQMAVAGPGGAAFIEALLQGETIGDAHDKAIADAPEFDLPADLGILIAGGALIRLIPGKPRMNALIAQYRNAARTLGAADGVLSLVARVLFAAILMVYFWASGLTKLGDGIFGIFTPSPGAYAQIFPRAMEAASYDTSQLGIFHWAVVLAGTWAEFILPALILVGLATRLAALGMIGFITLQSLTDLVGHGLWAEPEAVGRWFDRAPDSLIMDQRALWIFVLLVLVIKGAGPLSLDRLAERRLDAA